jgi:hypothetical protein
MHKNANKAGRRAIPYSVIAIALLLIAFLPTALIAQLITLEDSGEVSRRMIVGVQGPKNWGYHERNIKNASGSIAEIQKNAISSNVMCDFF